VRDASAVDFIDIPSGLTPHHLCLTLSSHPFSQSHSFSRSHLTLPTSNFFFVLLSPHLSLTTHPFFCLSPHPSLLTFVVLCHTLHFSPHSLTPFSSHRFPAPRSLPGSSAPAVPSRTAATRANLTVCHSGDYCTACVVLCMWCTACVVLFFVWCTACVVYCVCCAISRSTCDVQHRLFGIDDLLYDATTVAISTHGVNRTVV
jgi:hypothetical protein